MVEFVYVRGGDKTAPVIAAAAGVGYGVRDDYTAYTTVTMLDINWKRVNWARYMELIDQYRPTLALAPDYEYPWQFTALTRQIEDLRARVSRVLVCPKFNGAIQHVPLWCRIALSVPAPSYAGFLPEDLSVLAGRKIHLLGGKPEKQMDLITKLAAVGAIVESADGSFLAMKAANGQYFENGKWRDVRGKGIPTIELATMSARNIPKYLKGATGYKQPGLL